jgi:Ca-activated chloride channel family protein
LLISDGLANVGVTDPLMIRMKVQRYRDNEGITLSTFGVGLDYNEVLMTDMAETGSGNYYFIDAPDKMAGMFDREMNGLMKVAAQNTEIHIKIPEGITLTKTYPQAYTQTGDEVVVKLRDLVSEETKGLLFRFSIADNVKEALRFTTTLIYTDVADGKTHTLVNENKLSPTKNQEAYLTWFNRNVLEQTILYTSNEHMEQAMLETDRGNIAGAKKALEDNKQYLDANSEYVQNKAELRMMDSLVTLLFRKPQPCGSDGSGFCKTDAEIQPVCQLHDQE